MPEKIARKLLSLSDLTFFDSILKKGNTASKQKAVNLNREAFEKLYPDLVEASRYEQLSVDVRVTVFGPGSHRPYSFPRSVTKRFYKNWRLNGAAVPDPDGEPGRFDELKSGDVAVIEFVGDGQPEHVRLLVIAASVDPALRDLLAEGLAGRDTMQVISRKRLTEIGEAAGVGPDHPLRNFMDDPEIPVLLEEIAQGGAAALKRLKSKTGRPVSAEQFLKYRQLAEAIGRDGEGMVNLWLEAEVRAGNVLAFDWIAERDAVASWDFTVNWKGQEERVDVKSTAGPFDVAVHVSGAEMAAAAEGIPYRLIRVHDLDGEGCAIAVSDPINNLARQILESGNHLPAGILATNFRLEPGVLTWGKTRFFERPDQEEMLEPHLF